MSNSENDKTPPHYIAMHAAKARVEYQVPNASPGQVGRPSEERVRALISEFLKDVGLDWHPLHLHSDGEEAWAFWLHAYDSTSYVSRNPANARPVTLTASA